MNNWIIGEEFLSKQDSILKDLVTRYGPCDLRTLPQKEYFNTLLKGIISQQLSQQVAAGIYKKVCSYYNDEPAPEKMYETSFEQLRELGLSQQKAIYINDFCKHIVEKKVDLSCFTKMSDMEIMDALLPIKGFGRWTVEMFLIFALNRPNIWPIDDFGIKKAMNMLYGVDMKSRRPVYNGIAEKWEPWRTLATWYLWRYYSEHK